MTPIVAAALLALAHDHQPCAPAARHFVLLFGGQGVRYRPQTAHTWATFVRAPDGGDFESLTISWLPESGRVRPYALRAEPGRNYSLRETLGRMRTGAEEISLWGPLEVRADWFEGAVRHKAALDAGEFGFRSLDRYDRGAAVNHCVHAVTLTHPALHAEADPITWYGELVTRRVAEAAGRAGLFVDPGATHDWLFEPLGLAADLHRLKRRSVGGPVLRLAR